MFSNYSDKRRGNPSTTEVALSLCAIAYSTWQVETWSKPELLQPSPDLARDGCIRMDA